MTHGITLALITPDIWHLHWKKPPEYTWLFAILPRSVFGRNEVKDDVAAKLGIQKEKDFTLTLKMPKN
jgi:alcohol dehydrogenase YqhD (iron-dependent ADH family)